MQIVTRLPQPSNKHATCAWCRKDFDTIVELIDHVDNGHLDTVPPVPHSALSEAA